MARNRPKGAMDQLAPKKRASAWELRSLVENADPRQVADFLRPPSELLPKEEALKITLSIDSETVDLFKKVAKKNGMKHQRMMREGLKGYAKSYA